MTDAEKERLLGLLAKFIHETGISERLVSELAGEVAMSMDETSNEADAYRFYIETTLS
jgi:predicted membrane GTPase involved in stress response